MSNTNHVIHNCYDSHTHFLATGQVHLGLKLGELKDPHDVANLEIRAEHYRQNWLVGFGWNQHNWSNPEFPTRKILDLYFPETPVFFSRTDGHASWLNTCAMNELKKLGMRFDQDPEGGVILRDPATAEPTGILVDQAHIEALLRLPSYTDAQNSQFLLESQKIFNRGGFTHVRDLSMDASTWKLLSQLESQKKLTVCLDGFVTVESVQDFVRVHEQIQLMKSQSCQYLRIHGIKVFVDGSLGSQTAYLSENYLHSESNGSLIWSQQQLKDIFQLAWRHGYEVALHTIGDQSLHEIILAAREVSASGLLGRIHLEHVQLLRPDTLQLMKPLHIVCHMQPCHWLSDEKWLGQVLPQTLMKYLFSWELLRKNKIPFYFGSDSPIEPSQLLLTRKAMQLKTKKTIPALQESWMLHHQHPDQAWTKSWTEFDDEAIHQVYFDGEPLL